MVSLVLFWNEKKNYTSLSKKGMCECVWVWTQVWVRVWVCAGQGSMGESRGQWAPRASPAQTNNWQSIHHLCTAYQPQCLTWDESVSMMEQGGQKVNNTSFLILIMPNGILRITLQTNSAQFTRPLEKVFGCCFCSILSCRPPWRGNSWNIIHRSSGGWTPGPRTMCHLFSPVMARWPTVPNDCRALCL